MPLTDMLTDIEISLLESASESFGGFQEMERACRQYRKELSLLGVDSWKASLAQLQRDNPTAYAKVLSSLPAEKTTEIADFVDQYRGQPLPEIQRASTLSEAKAIAAAKGGGTIVKP